MAIVSFRRCNSLLEDTWKIFESVQFFPEFLFFIYEYFYYLLLDIRQIKYHKKKVNGPRH